MLNESGVRALKHVCRGEGSARPLHKLALILCGIKAGILRRGYLHVILDLHQIFFMTLRKTYTISVQ
jgi:hypothetical protein